MKNSHPDEKRIHTHKTSTLPSQELPGRQTPDKRAPANYYAQDEQAWGGGEQSGVGRIRLSQQCEQAAERGREGGVSNEVCSGEKAKK